MTEIIQTCPSDLVITVDKWRVSRPSNEHEHRHVLSICPIWSPIELQTYLREDYAKFYNYREGPYLGLLLVESAY